MNKSANQTFHHHDHDHDHHNHNHDDHSHGNHSHDNHSHGLFGGHGHHHFASTHVLLIAVVLTFSFAIVEAIAGKLSGSLVLLSDAGHMVSDALALGIAAFAAWVASRPPSAKHSYGYGRAEVLGAWLSSLLMVVIVIMIIIEALERFDHPHPVAGGWVMAVALIGLLLNLGVAWILSRGEKNLNIRAAILHVVGDILGSIAALISGAIIYFKGWYMIDPILSIFISVLILFSSLQLLRESLVVLMEGVPKHLDLNTVGQSMATIAKIKAVHDLHIWNLSSGLVMLSAHIEIDNYQDWAEILPQLKQLLSKQFNIEHITLQPEINYAIMQPTPFHAK